VLDAQIGTIIVGGLGGIAAIIAALKGHGDKPEHGTPDLEATALGAAERALIITDGQLQAAIHRADAAEERARQETARANSAERQVAALESSHATMVALMHAKLERDP
jgi:hypothetical protein